MRELIVTLSVALVLAGYMLPSLIGWMRGISGLPSLFILNLLCGWTLVIWLGCLVLAILQSGGADRPESTWKAPRREPELPVESPRLTLRLR